MSTPTAEQIAEAQKVLALAGNTANAAPPRYKACESLDRGGGGYRVFFSSVSQARVKKWIEDHCPRGSHFFMLTPDSQMLSYEAERATGGPQGEELDTWQPFDRAAYQAPELAPVNTNDPWADAWEGAQ